MNKVERDRCDQWAKYEKYKKEGNEVETEIALRNFESHKGYAEGICEALAVVGYNKSENLINFDEVLLG